MPVLDLVLVTRFLGGDQGATFQALQFLLLPLLHLLLGKVQNGAPEFQAVVFQVAQFQG